MPRFLIEPSHLFPLALVAFVGPTVSYVNSVFNTETRWLVLACLLMYLLLTRKLFRCLNGGFGLMLFANVLWCFLTWSWSDVPELTGAKAIAFAGVTLAATSGGMEWARTRRGDSLMAGLFPFTFLAIFAGFFGYSMPGASVDAGGGVTLYRGLTGNPNMLGMLAAMGLPYAVWRLYSSGRPGAPRHAYFVSVGLLIALVLIELLSMSRASFLVMGCIMVLYLLAQQMRRQAMYVLAITVVAVVAVLAAPVSIHDNFRRFAHKGNPDADIFFSRRGLWEVSYGQALKGGWFGGGYGVTIGETGFGGGLSAFGYGREKGNTQLAITEELGLIGLGLYGLLHARLFVHLARTFKQIRTRDEKVAFGIVTGAILGMTVNSVFEAWWVAPGAPESPYFWGLVGIALGLGRVATKTRQRRTSPNRQSRPELSANAHAVTGR
ncbi:MAG: hypothetical protein ACRECP_08485 [Methylocella sp.]